jgi:hypothetical protein
MNYCLLFHKWSKYYQFEYGYSAIQCKICKRCGFIKAPQNLIRYNDTQLLRLLEFDQGERK